MGSVGVRVAQEKISLRLFMFVHLIIFIGTLHTRLSIYLRLYEPKQLKALLRNNIKQHLHYFDRGHPVVLIIELN